MNIKKLNRVLVLQPENPDADSIASALALEEILGDQNIEVIIYSYVHISDYLKYIEGVDRITNEFPNLFDATIIVDTTTGSLLEKTLKGSNLTKINKKPVFVLDHHPEETSLPLPNAIYFDEQPDAVATGELVYFLAEKEGWPINKSAATHIIESILADTLGLSTEVVTPQSVRVVATMLELGASMSDIDKRRRKSIQKSKEIIAYKGKLLQRIEYFCDGKFALIHIPWEEIAKYSPHHNPSMLALEELRNAKGVVMSVAIKTYPDGKITGKIRANSQPVAGEMANHFGGGGHAYSSGFKVMDWSYQDLKPEIIKKASELINT